MVHFGLVFGWAWCQRAKHKCFSCTCYSLQQHWTNVANDFVWPWLRSKRKLEVVTICMFIVQEMYLTNVMRLCYNQYIYILMHNSCYNLTVFRYLWNFPQHFSETQLWRRPINVDVLIRPGILGLRVTETLLCVLQENLTWHSGNCSKREMWHASP